MADKDFFEEDFGAPAAEQKDFFAEEFEAPQNWQKNTEELQTAQRALVDPLGFVPQGPVKQGLETMTETMPALKLAKTGYQLTQPGQINRALVNRVTNNLSSIPETELLPKPAQAPPRTMQELSRIALGGPQALGQAAYGAVQPQATLRNLAGLAMDTAVDPLSYVGLGLVNKARSVAQAGTRSSLKPAREAMKIYGEILRPDKGEIRNIEIRKKGNINKLFSLAAQERLPIEATPDKKLDTAAAREMLDASLQPRHERLNEMLGSAKGRKIDLEKLRARAKIEIRNEVKNDVELGQMLDDVDTEFNAAIKNRGRFVDGQTLNQMKQGFWSTGYNATRPTAYRVGRKLGYVAKEAIHDTFPDQQIRELNEQIGERLQLKNLLENAHGRVIKGGRLGGYAARMTGAIVGSKIPIVGPLIGQAAGGILQAFETSPERMSAAAINAAKKAGMTPAPIPSLATPKQLTGAPLPTIPQGPPALPPPMPNQAVATDPAISDMIARQIRQQLEELTGLRAKPAPGDRPIPGLQLPPEPASPVLRPHGELSPPRELPETPPFRGRVELEPQVKPEPPAKTPYEKGQRTQQIKKAEERRRIWGKTLPAVAVAGGASAKAQAGEEADIITDYIIQMESNGDPEAVSPKGARGLMQIMPITLKDWNQMHPKEQHNISQLTADPQINMKIGTWYLNERIPQLLKSKGIEDTIENRLIANNWGAGNLNKHLKGVKGFKELPKETADYVAKYKKLAKL